MALIQRSDGLGIERRAAIPVQGVWDRMEQWKAKRDYGESVNPTDLHPEELSDDMSLRLNPMWYPLKEFPRKLLLERLNARWIFTVADNGDIYIGVDRISGTIEKDEFERLLRGMREKDPTLTGGRLRNSLDRQGHPTVGARFESDGKTKIGSARIAGHLEWNEENERFEVNEFSGRYMSSDARPTFSATHNDTNPKHLNNVARRMSSQLNVEIHAASAFS
ncbi:hypothetical protein GCM10010464_80040 [Pseudonocardia yunnanensis]